MNIMKIKNSKNKNKGFTLIEVIISMLILAIVAIPILRSFNVSMRTNIKADEKEAAVEYAQQLMESLQSLGATEVEKEFSERNSDFKDFLGGGTVDATDSGFINIRSGSLKAGDSRYYRILKGEAAGREYDAQISYIPAEIAYDVKDFPDISAFDRNKTLILNPAGSYVDYISESGGYMYDVSSESYIGYRSTSHENIYTESIYAVYKAAYQQICSAVNEALLERNPSNSQIQLLQLQDLMPQDAEIQKKMLTRAVERKTGIKVKHTGRGFFVTAVLDYSLRDSAAAGNLSEVQAVVSKHCAEAGVAVPGLNAVVADIWAETVKNDNFNHRYIIYKNSEPIKNLKSIYLMYDPLKRTEWSTDNIAVDMSEAISSYSDSNRLELYVVPQKGLIKMSNDTDYIFQTTDYIAPSITGAKISGSSLADINIASGAFAGGLIQLHYMKGFFNESGAFAAANSVGSIVAKETEKRDVIFDIQIKIYKHVSGREKPFNQANMLTQLDLTGY